MYHLSRRTFLKGSVATIGLVSGCIMAQFPKPFVAHGATNASRALIVYYSRTGNTRAVAQFIQGFTGGDIVEIQTVKPYPTEYKTTTEQAKKELAEGFMPPITTSVANMHEYDIVFVGSPNWWSTIAPPVMSFLSAHAIEEKRIAPFITHEGSALGHAIADIQKICPRASVLEGLAIRGSRAASAQDDVKTWLARLG